MTFHLIPGLPGGGLSLLASIITIAVTRAVSRWQDRRRRQGCRCAS
jgi:hypothetical protein